MNIVQPYARMMPGPTLAARGHIAFGLDEGMDLLRYVEWRARISHRSEDADPDTLRFVRSVVLSHGDWSVTEHASVSCDFYVDRGITHELVRHRLFAFTQESTRFVNYAKKMPASFIRPPEDQLEQGITDQLWQEAIDSVEDIYKSLVGAGVSPQIARSVFPNALASRIIITGNLRNWRHFFLMRTTKEAHPQMREVTIPLLCEFQAKIPILYEDIEPMAKQSDNLHKGR